MLFLFPAILMAPSLEKIRFPCSNENNLSTPGAGELVVGRLRRRAAVLVALLAITGLGVSSAAYASGQQVQAIATDDITAEDLAEALVGGDGVSITSVVFSGDPLQAGLFSGFNDPFGIDQGVVLSTGSVVTTERLVDGETVLFRSSILGPNEFNNFESDGVSTSFFTEDSNGDADLDELLREIEVGGPEDPCRLAPDGAGPNPDCERTFDAVSLTISFVPAGSRISLRYVFGSAEYNFYIDQGFNDIFGFFVNGENRAVIEDEDPDVGLVPVSVLTVNTGRNSDLYRDNDRNNAQNCVLFIPDPEGEEGDEVCSEFQIVDPPSGSVPNFNTALNGFTTVLTLEADVIPNQPNTIKLAIADVQDSVLDSAVMIEAGSFTIQEGFEVPPTTNPPGPQNDSPRQDSTSSSPPVEEVIVPIAPTPAPPPQAPQNASAPENTSSTLSPPAAGVELVEADNEPVEELAGPPPANAETVEARKLLQGSVPNLFDFTLLNLFAALAVGIVLVLLVGLPARLVGASLDSSWHLLPFAKWAERRRKRAPQNTRKFRTAVQFGVIAVLAALISGLTDINRVDSLGGYLQSVMMWLSGFLLLSIGGSLVMILFAKKMYPGSRSAFDYHPATLSILAVSVAVSMMLGFDPPVVFGLVFGLTFGFELATRKPGVLETVGTVYVLLAGVGAWLVYSGAVSLGVANTALIPQVASAIAIGAISGLPISLLPLKLMEGFEINRLSKALSWGLFFAALTAFALLASSPGEPVWQRVENPLFWTVVYIGFVLFALVVWIGLRVFVKRVEGRKPVTRSTPESANQ